MNGEFSYALAFATGLFGSFHCIGMCSGINGGFTLGYGRTNNLLPLLAYHGTRIGVYTLFGISGALLGRVVVQVGIVGKSQGILMIVAGILVVLLGLKLLGLMGKSKTAKLKPQTVKLATPLPLAKRPFTPFLAGLLNGLVPCSLVFSVAVKAAATAEPLQAGLLMLAFGAGTMPSMGAISLLGSVIGARVRGGMAKLAGLTVVLLGLWTIYEGVAFFDIMRGLANW
ncbi:MAG: sulfite exporter TauE/SafE family protein [Pseudomonadota bacterium]